MTPKEQLKHLVDQIPEEKAPLIETFLRNLLGEKEIRPPKGKLGLKKHFDRKAFYDEALIYVKRLTLFLSDDFHDQLFLQFIGNFSGISKPVSRFRTSAR